ncbi:MAG: DUF3488 and transglutaminase-like domain-containing protein [Acidobacteriota bacterium]|nr:DUF3488 and transglutaminase-like domain-containing protein [Acidobacteriota bacterium]
MYFKTNNIETIFKILSYLTVLCGFISLVTSGTFSVFVFPLFIFVIILAWFLEDSKWQISERLGTFLIVLALPGFYLTWRMRLFSFENVELMVTGVLSLLILSLSGIKILQKKSDRDWIFLYLMSFFQVLLAAGLSISVFYLASFLLYVLITVCAVIVFEIRKTSNIVQKRTDVNASKIIASGSKNNQTNILQLHLNGAAIVALTVIFALPLFFLLPRVGGAGIGGSQNSVSTYTGFSDSVELGNIGKLQQNDQVVMRVKLEKNGNLNNIRWRGVALNKFENNRWSKSRTTTERFDKGGNDYVQVNYAANRDNLTEQIIYLEPIDTNVLFALPRPVIVRGNFPMLFKDSDDGISFPNNNSERISYRVTSDNTLPNIQSLRTDNSLPAPEFQRYLQLPEKLDARIPQLAKKITGNSGNKYDKAKALENYLQNNFGYTLELKAGGEEPLAEFLFDYQEGHCEYFATAMAVMLRTQGVAARIVNGFQQGEYNETADVYVVKQRNAHSWVVVYFPAENVWIAFDPTPFAGQNLESNSSTGIVGKFNNYVEALETFWIQYFVAYDNQEQRSFFRSVKSGFAAYQNQTSSWLSGKQRELTEWWKEVRGDKGFETSAKAIGYGIVYLIALILGIILSMRLYRKIIKLKIWQNIFNWLKRKNEATIVEFYERMQKVLASKGFRRESHQTPLEFAFAFNMPEAVRITEKYNCVRFGEKNLSNDESLEIEDWLDKLEKTES